MTSPIEGFMSNIKPKEVSFVKKPANKKEFLLTKAQHGDNMDELIQVVLETEAENEEELVKALESQGLSEKTIEALKGVARLTGAYSDEIDTDAFQAFAKAIGYELPVEKSEEEEEPVITKSDLEGLSEDVREKILAMEKNRKESDARMKKLEETLEKREEERRLNEFVGKCEDLDSLGKAEELGAILKSVADNAGDEQAESVLEAFRSVHKIAENPDLFRETGSSRPGVISGSASEEIEKQANELVKSENISIGKAWDKVLRDNPELTRRYSNEQRGL